jgi:hypothetical protein
MKSNPMSLRAPHPLVRTVAVLAMSLSGTAHAHPGNDGGAHDLLAWGALAAGVVMCAAGAKQLKKISARRGSR